MKWLVILVALFAGPIFAEPAPEMLKDFGAKTGAQHLLVRGTTDLAAFAPVLDAFAVSEPGVSIRYEQWGSNDLYQITAAACQGQGAPADLVISSAVDQLAKLVNDGCAKAHRSVATAALPAALNWRGELFGITREPAVIVYNRALVPADEAPRNRFDLLDLLRSTGQRYEGRVATYDIEASGLGYLFAFADAQEATTFGSLIEAFGRAKAVATCCSSEILDGVASGRYLIAYNLLGSYALARAEQDPNLVVVAPDDYTLILSRGAMIPLHAPDAEVAGRLIDFLVSAAGRASLTRMHLIVGPEELASVQPPDTPVAVRPIPLSPVLLVGLDKQRRAQFIALWRMTFPNEKGTTAPVDGALP